MASRRRPGAPQRGQLRLHCRQQRVQDVLRCTCEAERMLRAITVLDKLAGKQQPTTATRERQQRQEVYTRRV